MRRICLRVLAAVLAAAIVAPVSALADRSPSEGSLGVTGVSGTVVVQGRGVIYGHFDQGTIMVLDYRPDDPLSVPAISSGRARPGNGPSIVTGSDIRFLLPSGRYTIELIATDVDASAVGRGTIVVSSGLAGLDNGTLTANGRPLQLTKSSTSLSFGGSAGAQFASAGPANGAPTSGKVP